MPSIEDVVEQELRGVQAAVWQSALTTAAKESLGRRACALIEFDSVLIAGEWQRLDDPHYRLSAVENDPGVLPRCVELLEPAIAVIRQAVRGAGFGSQSRTSLRARFNTVAPSLLRLPTSVATMIHSPFADNWSFIGDEIARQLYDHYMAPEFQGSANEWRLMHHLILAEYFRQCTLPEARLVAMELRNASRGMLSIRGTLVCTAAKVSRAGVASDGLNVTPFRGAIHLHHAPLSALLESIADESRGIPAGQGVMSRIVGLHHQDVTEVRGGERVAPALMARARSNSYPRYEYSILAYMATAGIEQLLRSCARQQSINDVRAGNVPRKVIEWIDHLQCNASVIAQVKSLFDSAGNNTRNRLMHSGFLLTESTHFIENLALADPGQYAAALARPRPYTPENIARLAIECLRDLDAAIYVTRPLIASDFEWASRWSLTAAELDFGLHVRCDLLPWPGGTTREEAIEWQTHLSRYFSAVMPGLGQFFRLGYAGFVNAFSAESLPSLHALGMVFEAIYRLTVHMLGMPVLGSSVSGDQRHFQFLMLENETGMLQHAYVDRLVDYLPSHEASLARRVLNLACKSRDALAHGAVVQYDQTSHMGMGHLFLKATQALLEAGEHHMTRQGAWYRWRTLHPDRHGYDREDWFAAEAELLQRIDQLGNPRGGGVQ